MRAKPQPQVEDCEAENPNAAFDDAVSAIVRAAKQFKQVAQNGQDGEEENTYIQSNEENPYSAKIPVGAFALRLAHQVWRDTHTPVHAEECVPAMIPAGAFAFKGPMPDGATPCSPLEAITAIAEHLDSEDWENIISALKGMNEEEVAATPPLPPE